MMTYLENENGDLTKDGQGIPKSHPLYALVLAEVEAGMAEILPYAEPEPSPTEKVAAYRAAVSLHIDGVAQSYGYDSILTAVTYADEPAGSLDQMHGKALREWRSLCWDKCRADLGVWLGGGTEPSIIHIINSLPAYVSPV